MIGNLLIGLREGLEVALVISILAAYAVKTGRRHLLAPIWSGAAVAVALSLGVGALLTFGASELDDDVQEAIGGTLSVIAVALVTWMIFWMASAGRRLSGELRGRLDAAAHNPWALALLAFLAVAREGLETALFLWAATQAAASGGSAAGPLLGALTGLALAAALGWLIYNGALRVNLGRFFAWTGSFLIVVAAGVLAYGVHDLQEAGVLPGEDVTAYDLSGFVAHGSLPDVLLRGIFNFQPTPSVLQVVAWVGYVVVVGVGFARRLRSAHSGGGQATASSAGTPVGGTVTAEVTGGEQLQVQV